jgi:hypothetical protein
MDGVASLEGETPGLRIWVNSGFQLARGLIRLCGPSFGAAAISLTILLPPEKLRLRALLDHQTRLHRQGQAKYQAQAKMRRLGPDLEQIPMDFTHSLRA